jgi:natural product precursor
MKKLSKLKINSEKIIEKEDLMQLRGGYGEGNGYFWCMCNLGVPDNWFECYLSPQHMIFDLETRCGSWGGSCDYLWSC